MNDLFNKNRKILESITKAHTEFLELDKPILIFEKFLDLFLTLTDSEYGFVGEVLHDKDNQPYLKTYAITNIAWNEETRIFYEENIAEGLEFTNLNTLFGQVMVTEKPVIANHPATDPRRGSLPDKHPPLDAFLGIPIPSRGKMIGMIGISNRPNGYSQEIIDFLAPLTLTCGNFIQMIHDGKLREKVLRELTSSENRANAILNNTHDAIITIDDNAIIDTVNPAIEKMFGYTRQELVGKNVNILMPEPDRSHHDTYVRRYLKTGKAKIIGQNREVIAARKDGSLFPIDLAITQFFIPGRHLFTGIIRDISELKQAQARTEETLSLLAKSNENMLAILNESGLGVVMIDHKGAVQFLSRTCEKLLNCNLGNMLGQPWEQSLPFNNIQKRDIKGLFKVDFDSRKSLTFTLSRGRSQDVWIELDIHDDPRNPDGKILFLHDKTEVHKLRSSLNQAATYQMTGNSKAMRKMLELFDQVAVGDWTVLISGETGVGKELVARGLHAQSSRSDKPFIAVNCGGLTDSLLTSQLFGHRRGAFTGATTDQEGVFEAANGGTIFLDEISEISSPAQAVLLRVLQEREVIRVGETKPRAIDVRVIAATNRDLAVEVKAERFREDLLYRIQVARIRVPPLRERLEDVPKLVEFFLAGAFSLTQKRISRVTPDAMACLCKYSWPGNVRELKNTIEAATITCSGQQIDLKDLPPEIQKSGTSLPVPELDDSLPSPSQSHSTNNGPREKLLQALHSTEGNRAKAAELLGMSRATFYRHLQKYGLDQETINEHLRHL